MKHLSSFVLASALFLFSSFAAAQVNPVYVVDVKGLDATRVREGVARELHGDAVAPDDPRARDAAGYVTIETKDGKATVTFRKVGAPVSRTVDLPSDPSHAESTAVLLTGNLARDEAGELLDGLKKPAPPKPPSSPAPEPPKVDRDPDRDAMHAILQGIEDHDARAIQVVGWSLVGLGAASGGVATYLAATDRGDAAWTFASIGAGWVTGGTVLLLFFRPDESLRSRMDRGGLTVDEVEKLWQEDVEKAKSARTGFATVLLAMGATEIGVGIGSYAVRVHDEENWQAPMLLGVGALSVITGIGALARESEIETSWQAWKAMHAPPPPTAIRPEVGLAPIPGGAYGTVGFAF